MIIIRALVEGIINVINAFPSNHGISDTFIPSTIVEGKHKLDFKRKMILFGAYVLAYTGNKKI